jgi:hypothetical protein
MINRLKSLRPGHIKLVVMSILKPLRTSQGLLALVAIVIAIEGAFISWNLYDVRDDARIAQQGLSEIKGHVSDLKVRGAALDDYAEASNTLMVKFDKYLAYMSRELGDIESNISSIDYTIGGIANDIDNIAYSTDSIDFWASVIESNTGRYGYGR